MNILPSRWPGEVVSYDGPSRTCRVSITGITEGSTDLPIAVFENPLGDRPGDTEIRILPGDLVWLSFECGDPRFPIITGYRTPRVGNPVDWRRWRHANIEITADKQMRLISGEATVMQAGTTIDISAVTKITCKAPEILLDGSVTVSKNFVVQGEGGGASSMVGNFSLLGSLDITGNQSNTGNIAVTGDVTATGTISDGDGVDTA